MLVSAWLVTNCNLEVYSTRFQFPEVTSIGIYVKIQSDTEVLSWTCTELQHLTLAIYFFKLSRITSIFNFFFFFNYLICSQEKQHDVISR